MEYLLHQDDCAPDSLEYSESELYQLTGHLLVDFTDTPTIKVDELTLQWHLDGYVLEYSGDDPFYRVFKLDNPSE